MKYCSVSGCFNKSCSKGFCRIHYMHIYHYGKIKERTVRSRNKIYIEDSLCRMELYNVKSEVIGETVFDFVDYGKIKDIRWGLLSSGYVFSSCKKNTFIKIYFRCTYGDVY